jgi:hypothetical protein
MLTSSIPLTSAIMLSSNYLAFYTDPGAGALLWQLLLASFFGAVFYARLVMRRIKARVIEGKKH